MANNGYFARPEPDPRHFQLPDEHEKFYRELQLTHVEGDYHIVHAGLSGRSLAENDLDYALRRARVAIWE